MKVTAPPRLPILWSDGQARLLTALPLDPERERSVSDLAALSEISVPTAVREVDRAERAGLIRSRNIGRTRPVAANTRSFAYEPLRELLLRAFGPLSVVAAEFADLDGIGRLFIVGSWAARYAGDSGHEPRDVDVLIVGTPDRGSAYEAAEQAERWLHRPVQVTIRTDDHWENPGQIRSRATCSVDHSSRSTATPQGLTVTWQSGRGDPRHDLAGASFLRVAPSDELAERFHHEADRHLVSARAVNETDSTGWPTTRLARCVQHCWRSKGCERRAHGGSGCRACAVPRRLCAVPDCASHLQASECPNVMTPTTTVDDSSFAIDAAADMLNSARQVVKSGRLDPF